MFSVNKSDYWYSKAIVFESPFGGFAPIRKECVRVRARVGWGVEFQFRLSVIVFLMMPANPAYGNQSTGSLLLSLQL